MLDETILFDPEAKQFCLLNGSAAVMWDRLETPCTVEDLAAELCARFDGVNQAAAEEDVRKALEQLKELALVQVDQ